MRRAGFTLIEMMVVVGVVAILALLLVPSYADRLIQEQITEAMALADVAKKPVAAAWSATQTFPRDNTAAGLPPADKIVSNHVSAVQVENGVIHMTFGNRANNQIRGKVLSLRPAVVDDAPIVPVAWVCGFAEAPAKMSARNPNRTNIPANYLPLRCRLQ